VQESACKVCTLEFQFESLLLGGFRNAISWHLHTARTALLALVHEKLFVWAALVLCVANGFSQAPCSSRHHLSSQIIVPQSRPFGEVRNSVEVTAVDIRIDISDQIATTIMDVALSNRFGSRLESQVVRRMHF
jgi:hypothetical protein